MKRAALYLRVSTIDQTTANQERELRQVAERAGWEVDKVYKDHGISGSKGRDKRPAFDALHKAAARREIDVVMAWSVDRFRPAAGGDGLARSSSASRVTAGAFGFLILSQCGERPETGTARSRIFC
jgi:DNA invertase Pin-like site-specific DNA recombinase